MKSLIKILAVAALAFTLASCGTQQNSTNGNQYPNSRYPSNGGIFKTPDGTVYREGDVYRDGSGNVYQNGRVIRNEGTLNLPGILGTNGVYTNGKKLPPGQAKKIYGGEAKDYAPGQQNKSKKYKKNKKNK